MLGDELMVGDVDNKFGFEEMLAVAPWDGVEQITGGRGDGRVCDEDAAVEVLLVDSVEEFTDLFCTDALVARAVFYVDRAAVW